MCRATLALRRPHLDRERQPQHALHAGGVEAEADLPTELVRGTLLDGWRLLPDAPQPGPGEA